ncbi:DNA translocase FtsK [Streptomyces xiamenensis]|uniref:DNA translocase FtsK n=1 Tax=Streptomyces xiamenensis TaxID=408015 RepID=UPI0035E229DA
MSNTNTKSRETDAWRHGIVSTPLYTAAFFYTGGLALGVAEDSGSEVPLALLGVGSITGVLSASASRFIRASTPDTGRAARWFHTGFTAAWTSAAAAWLNWTAHGTPWTLASAAVLGAATAALTPFYAVDRWLRAPEIAKQWAEEAKAERGGDDWEAAFAKVGARGVTVRAKRTSTRGGYHLPVGFSPGGATYDALQGLLRPLEVAMDLREGGLVLRKDASGKASEAVLEVTERDVLSETIPLPPEAHPITIKEPISLGTLESGEPFEILFRQNSIFIAGMKGSGKSVSLHIILSMLTRCTDAIVWMIDMAQGNTAKRWLRPWVEGWKDAGGRVIDRPILDWVATSEGEAVRLLEAAHSIADGRARRMKGSKITPSRDTPALIIITDEGSDLMAWSVAALKPKTRTIKKGRKAAIDFVDSAQRGTGPNTGGGEITSQYDTVIGMQFARRSEGQFVFPDYYNQTDLSKLPAKGCMMCLDQARRAAGTGPERGRWYFEYDDDEPSNDGRFQGDEIEKLAVARWTIRPDLDEESQKDAAPHGYADRWSSPDRIEWLLDACGLPTPDRPAAHSAAAPLGGTAPPTKGKLPNLPGLDHYLNRHGNNAASSGGNLPNAGAEDVARVIAEAERVAAQAAADTAKAEADAAQVEANTARTESTDRKHPRRDEVIALVEAAGDEGTAPDAVIKHLAATYPTEEPPSRQSITNWFKAHPNIHNPSRGRWVWGAVANQDNQTGSGDDRRPPAAAAPPAATPAGDSALSELVSRAIPMVVVTKKATPEHLQQTLGIDLETAGKVLAFLESTGTVGPADTSGNREIKVTAADLHRTMSSTVSTPAADTTPVFQVPEGVELDDLKMAAELLISTQFGSSSMIQRKMRIGFEHANRVMDALTQLGVLGPANGSHARAVLLRPGDPLPWDTNQN